MKTELSVDFFATATPCNPLGRYTQNDKVTYKISCHTEALAEVSIKSKYALNFFGFFVRKAHSK